MSGYRFNVGDIVLIDSEVQFEIGVVFSIYLQDEYPEDLGGDHIFISHGDGISTFTSMNDPEVHLLERPS